MIIENFTGWGVGGVGVIDVVVVDDGDGDDDVVVVVVFELYNKD